MLTRCEDTIEKREVKPLSQSLALHVGPGQDPPRALIASAGGRTNGLITGVGLAVVGTDTRKIMIDFIFGLLIIIKRDAAEGRLVAADQKGYKYSL